MGFETVECFKNIMSVADKEGTFLVDNITSLVQNALFPVEKNYEMDMEAANRSADELVEFTGTVRHAIFVSDYIYSDAERYRSADRILCAVPEASVPIHRSYPMRPLRRYAGCVRWCRPLRG